MQNNKLIKRVGLFFGLWVISHGLVFAEFKLPNSANRLPDLSLDPIKNNRKSDKPVNSQAEPMINETDADTSIIEENQQTLDESPVEIPEEILEEIPSLDEVNTEVNTIEPPTSEVEPMPLLKQDDSSPYSYSLFLDVDYIYKASGGAQTAMSMGGDMNGNDDMANSTPPSASAYVYLLHFYGEYDTAKARWWNNGTFVAHAIYGGGDSPTNTVGDLRSVSNIDASFMGLDGNRLMPGLDILELWYEHRFPYNKSSVRLGIGYLSSDFYKSNYTGLFLTSGIGSIGTEILWNTMASNPPNTTLGLWYKTSITENVSWQSVAFDGFPDHSTNPIAVKLNKDEGVFTATELAWLQGTAKQKGYFKFGLGAWYLKQNMVKIMQDTMMVGYDNYEGPKVAGTGGMYAVIDKAFGDKLGIFFKGGRAAEGINKYSQYFTTGVVYKGLLKSRPNDIIGAAVVQSKLSDDYINANGTDEQGELNSFTQETIYELTYSVQINNWLMLQPDIQYVLQPGMNSMNDAALVFLIRAEFTLY